MTWRDELRPASFRSIPFFVDSTQASHTLHRDEHVFPGRDSPGDAVDVVDLGSGIDKHRIEAFVVGDDYREQRDALVLALRMPGSGRLVHPYRGELTVSVVGTIQVSESRQRGGFARIQFECVETFTPRLRRSPDTSAVVERDLDAFLEDLSRDFGEQYDTEDVPAPFQESSRSAFDTAVSALSEAYSKALASAGEVRDFAGAVSQYVDDLEAFASAPATAMKALIGAVGAVAALPLELANAGAASLGTNKSVVAQLRSALDPLVHFGDRFVPIPSSTVNRASEEQLRSAVVQGVEGAALGHVCRALARLPFDSRRHAIETRDELVSELQRLAEEGSAGGDTASGAQLYEAIAAARTAITAHLSAVAARLPELDDYTVPIAMPALVIAHQLYGDARREEELVTRNRPSTPGLISQGTVLEVRRV